MLLQLSLNISMRCLVQAVEEERTMSRQVQSVSPHLRSSHRAARRKDNLLYALPRSVSSASDMDIG